MNFLVWIQMKWQMKHWVVKVRVGIFLSYVKSDSFKITWSKSEIRIWFRIRNKLKIYKSDLIFDFEFPVCSRWNLTTMFWQKIQIFYEYTYIYQIYIKIHAMSVCLSFILIPFPWTNLRAKYIYGILLTWWIYSDYL